MLRQTHYGRAAAVIACFFLLLLGNAGGHSALAEEAVHWRDFGQLCGSIASVVPIKKLIRRPDGTTETLQYANHMKGATVSVFKAEGQNTPCCSASSKVGETVTDKNGRFRFSDYAGGNYWLIVHLKDREVKVPLKVENYDKGRCDEPNIDRIIFADASPEPKAEVRII